METLNEAGGAESRDKRKFTVWQRLSFAGTNPFEFRTHRRRLTFEMKTLIVTVSLALAGAATGQAQMFRPSTTTGAVLGAVTGGLIGGHNGDHWAEGMVIGAVAGGLIGSAVAPQEPVYQAPPPVYQAPATVVYPSQTQVINGQPTTVVQAPTVPNAPTVPDAPTIYQQQPQVVYAPAPAPQVVYAPAPPPQVVYVESAPRVVYPPVYVAPRPAITIGFGSYWGPRYYGSRYYPAYRSHGRGHRH